MGSEEYQLTPREFAIMEAEQEDARLGREHMIAMKAMELNLARENHQADIKVKELDSKWSSWLKIPRLIILLPVLVPLAIAYGFKREAPKKFWDLLG